MRGRLPPVKVHLTRSQSHSLKGTRVYLDPSYSPQSAASIIDLLPLLTDRAVIFDPSDSNLRSWGYNPRRFRRLQEENFFVPIYVKPPKDRLETSLVRDELIGDPQFFSDYNEAVEEDIENPEFHRIANSVGLDPADAAFSINWDLLVCQILRTSMVVEEAMMPIVRHKLENTLQDLLGITETPLPIRQHKVIHKFLYRTLRRLPTDLTVQEIVEFREDNRAVELRGWLSSQFSQIEKDSEMVSIEPDEELFNAFNELVAKYGSRAQTISGVSATIAGGLVGWLAGPLAGISVGVLGQLSFPQLLYRVWRRVGSRNWVFFMLKLRQSGHRRRAT